MSLAELMDRARACRLCADQLAPRPVLRLSPASRVLIIGQAPGSRVHESGVPWDDASGVHLREWLAVDRATFDDPDRFGILPMGLCYPGAGKSGDLAPPRICAETWHGPLVEALVDVRLTLLIGQYAQRAYLGRERQRNLTETVRAFATYGDRFPLPHPSWRSRTWMKRNPWFSVEVLPALRVRVRAALSDATPSR